MQQLFHEICVGKIQIMSCKLQEPVLPSALIYNQGICLNVWEVTGKRDELLKRVVSVFIAHSTTNCSLVGRFLRGVHPASLAAALPSLAFPQTTVYIII